MNGFYSPMQDVCLWLGAWLYGQAGPEEVAAACRELGHEPLLIDDLLTFRTRAGRVRLVLGGPGDAVPIPVAAAQHAGGAIVVSEELVLVLVDDTWQWFEVSELLPAPAGLSPGDASLLLSEAVRDATRVIESKVRVQGGVPVVSEVGSLVPPATPGRSARLVARADQVAAIVAAVPDHELDQELLPLGRQVRQARVAAVDYAVAEWGRLAG